MPPKLRNGKEWPCLPPDPDPDPEAQSTSSHDRPPTDRQPAHRRRTARPPTDHPPLVPDSDDGFTTITSKRKNSTHSSSNSIRSSTSSSSSSAAPVLHTVQVLGLPPSLKSNKTLAQSLKSHAPHFLVSSLSVNARGIATIASLNSDIRDRLTAYSHQIGVELTIQTYNRQQSSTAPPRRHPTFSCVLRGVELDIDTEEVARHLQEASLPFVRLWRIDSRATNRPTTLIRILTEHQKTLDHLLSKGLYMFYHLYRAEASHPPPARPTQCGKCFKYEHATAQCPARQPTCGRCSGAHPTTSCSSQTAPKCTNCGGDHTAYTFKCPSRPTAPATIATAAPLRPAAPTPENKKSTRNIVSFLTTALLNIVPDQKERVQAFLFPLIFRHFGYKVAASYSGNTVHISFA